MFQHVGQDDRIETVIGKWQRFGQVHVMIQVIGLVRRGWPVNAGDTADLVPVSLEQWYLTTTQIDEITPRVSIYRLLVPGRNEVGNQARRSL